jgi:hypothetical protein
MVAKKNSPAARDGNCPPCPVVRVMVVDDVVIELAKVPDALLVNLTGMA